MKSGLEKDWETKEGYRCIIVLNTRSGSRCGYIFIPKDDKAYVEPTYSTYEFGGIEREVMRYNEDYDIEVHCGITYGETGPTKKFPANEPREGTWLGFDTAHYDDAVDYDAWEELLENDADKKIFNTLKEMEFMSDGTVRSHDFMVQECENMSKQISLMTKGKKNE